MSPLDPVWQAARLASLGEQLTGALVDEVDTRHLVEAIDRELAVARGEVAGDE